MKANKLYIGNPWGVDMAKVRRNKKGETIPDITGHELMKAIKEMEASGWDFVHKKADETTITMYGLVLRNMRKRK